MKNILLVALTAITLFACWGSTEVEVLREKAVISYAPNLKLDPSLTAKEWQSVPAFKFKKAITQVSDVGVAPVEAGEVKLLYDDKYIYVGAKLNDTDVIDEGVGN